MKAYSAKWYALVCCLVITVHAAAEQIQYYDQTWKYGLALTSTMTDNGAEIIIQLSAPTSYGWAAVGTGAHMDGSVMFFIYPSTANNKVTLSVRQAKDHTPIPTNMYQTSLLKSSVQNGTMSATISWKAENRTFAGKLDIGQHKQPLIWALGPNQHIASSDTNFNVLQHADASHGVLFADMPYSQNPTSVQPDLAGSTQNVNMQPQPAYYHNLVVIHALALCTAFLVFFPIGVIGLRWRWTHGFYWHWIVQTVGVVAALVGLGVAIAQSILGIVHDSFNQPHQLLGIALCALLPLQAFFGRAQHLRNKIYKKWTWASWAHVLGGRVLIYGAGVNAALGLLLVGLRLYALIAGVISLGIVIVMELVAITAAQRRRQDGKGSGLPRVETGYHKLQDLTLSQEEYHPQHPR